MSESTYTHQQFTNCIKYQIKKIIECGSRDCLDAIIMNEYYKPEIIYSFECNPESILVCEKNIISYENIKLIKKAVSNNNGIIDFYATDMDKSNDKNIGASSALFHRDNKENYIQKKILVLTQKK